MAHLTPNQYMEEICKAIEIKNGNQWADLVGHKHPHVASYKLHLPEAQSITQKFFDPPLDDMIAFHLRAVWAVSENNYIEAYNSQVLVVQSFLKVFQSMKEENWALPVLYNICLDLRLFALRADCKNVKEGTGKENEILEKSAEYIMNCFRVCVSDTRAAIENSKKWGMLSVVNQLFKIYFKINKLQLCKPLTRAIDSLQIKDQFPKAHLVTYKFFVGKKAMFDSEYKLADEFLSYSFEHCHKESKKNKRIILIYLLPVKMQRGKMPSLKLLKRYNLHPFIDVRNSVVCGNLLALTKALDEHQAFFIKAGIYLILEKLKIITYRNLFKRISLILNTHQLSIEAFRVGLHNMGQTDVDTDEVHCIIANLVYEGYIKGYISFQHQKLIISKQNPFPALTTFL
ncbi:PCI domain-containing protein 2 isoform X1 [Hydra vulgaris]|uniref:CSN12-like protein n=1 Tax=Hydra vulgaris TaxID=6087 RepID=T2MBR7_HYDVU|nr:PCI domain-containing protein 2 [Hydra vulgaris]